MTWVQFVTDGSMYLSSAEVPCLVGCDGYHYFPPDVDTCACGYSLIDPDDDTWFRDLFGYPDE